MLEEILENLKSQCEEWAKTGIEQLGKEISDRFYIPEPDGDFELLRRFDLQDDFVGKGGIYLESNAWRIEAYNSLTSNSDEIIRKVRLFTTNEPDLVEHIVVCRFWAKTSMMKKLANFSLGFEREAEFFGIKGGKLHRNYGVSVGGYQWREYEVRNYCQSGSFPVQFYLDLDFFEAGTVWLKNISLLKAPV